MTKPTSATAVACVISAAIGMCIGLIAASPAEMDDPSKEFQLTVYDRDFLAYDLVWEGGIALSVTDADRDGVIDRWEFAENGETIFRVKDRNNDHKLDHWWKRAGENRGILAADDDFDGTVDQVHDTVTVTKQ